MNCHIIRIADKIAGTLHHTGRTSLRLMSSRPRTSNPATITRNMSAQSKSTVINEELTKFSKYSREWWDPNGASKMLQRLNALRVPFASNGILDVFPQGTAAAQFRRSGPRPLEGLTVADVGCGAGLYSEALAKIGADVTGIDASPEMIDVAREHALLTKDLTKNLRYINATVDTHANDHVGHYDAVVCSEVIEHVDNKNFFVEQCVKMVKSGGSLFFTTINQTWAAWLVMIIGAEYIARAIPKGTHHYNLLMSDKELENMLIKNGCHIRSVQGMMVKPNFEWTYMNTRSVSYLMHAVKK